MFKLFICGQCVLSTNKFVDVENSVEFKYWTNSCELHNAQILLDVIMNNAIRFGQMVLSYEVN